MIMIYIDLFEKNFYDYDEPAGSLFTSNYPSQPSKEVIKQYFLRKYGRLLSDEEIETENL